MPYPYHTTWIWCPRECASCIARPSDNAEKGVIVYQLLNFCTNYTMLYTYAGVYRVRLPSPLHCIHRPPPWHGRVGYDRRVCGMPMRPSSNSTHVAASSASPATTLSIHHRHCLTYSPPDQWLRKHQRWPLP
jgi:hypothetical protein